MTMGVFKNYLYVGNDQGEVFRTDGSSWSKVNWTSGSVTAMAEFNGNFYAATQTKIWKSPDGSSWQQVVDNVFGEAKNHDITSLEVFNAYLYAGVGRDNANGIQIWRTSDGTNWNKFHELIPQGGLSAVLYPGHVHALRAFKGYLYIGEYHGQGIYRTDGSLSPSPSHWEELNPINASGDNFRMFVLQDKLYLGLTFLFSYPSVEDMLYCSSDGTQWDPVPGGPKRGSTASGVRSLFSTGGRLYVGTANSNTSGEVVMWEYSDILPDHFEPNNSLQKATLLQLGATTTQTAVEYEDLTLHSLNDVDFFRIQFQGTPYTGSCEPTSSVGGWIHFTYYPPNLTIKAQEEYCRPLTLDFYDYQGNKIGTSINQGSFPCPSGVFQDDMLFLTVSYGKAPVRYNLTIEYSSWRTEMEAILYTDPPLIRYRIPELVYHDFEQLVIDWEKYTTGVIEVRTDYQRAELAQTLGVAARLSGKYEQADDFFQQSLALYQKLGLAGEQANLWRNLGELYAAQGKVQTALENFQRAFQMHAKLEDSEGIANDKLSLGKAQLAFGEARQALADLQEALSLCLQADKQDWRLQALILFQQARAFSALDEREASLSCLQLAQHLSSRIAEPETRREIEQRLQLFRAKAGTPEPLQEKVRPPGLAEMLRLQALSRIIGKL
jgi:tetratricopeptide (TPR) repeat protein